MTEDFWNELNEGEIHARDSLQFELKSEFFIDQNAKQNIYKQEVYLFIPNSLQVNAENYSKQQFYLDQTNLIRYKTPLMKLTDLKNLNYSPSPLSRLNKLIEKADHHSFISQASEELKLFAAIFRAAIREKVFVLVKELKKLTHQNENSEKMNLLCSEISEVTQQFRQLQLNSHSRSNLPSLIRHFKYIDEFISNSIEEFLVILIKQYRSIQDYNKKTDSQLTELVVYENLYRKEKKLIPKTTKGHPITNEAILYRQGLLHRFVLEALLLNYFRFSLEEKYRHILGAAAAAIAMLVYMTLLVWNMSSFVINSFPFVALAVFLYVLKDRIKEGFKIFYAKKAHRWFADYSTEITNSKNFKVGRLKESFSFIDREQLPQEVLKIRTHDFNEELQAFLRHESIIYYKRELVLNSSLNFQEERRREVTTIFRFNIHQFLQKASNPFETKLILNPYTKEITENPFPKVYHLNLIILNSKPQSLHAPKIEIKAFRVVIDKNGIKRVEQVRVRE